MSLVLAPKIKKSGAIIIGLTGTNAAGKGEIGRFLEEQGFSYSSLSDEVRREANTRGLEHSRENLIRIANEIRQAEGAGALASRLASHIKGDRFVVDSIRNPKEIDELRKAGNFVLLAVDAPIETRFERARNRGRNENAKNIEEFRNIENREKSSSPHAQQITRCMELADETIQNDGSLETLRERVRDVLKKRNFSC